MSRSSTMKAAAVLLSALALVAEATPVTLFRRQARTYPAEDVAGPAPMQSWIDSLNAAKAAGLIPAVPPTTLVNGNPTYPAGTDLNAACSWTVSHCFGGGENFDVIDAPTGMVGIAFDDGPQLASPPLYQFLQSQNQNATHFMIGSRILDNPTIFDQAVAAGGHIAVHTWSHAYMTTLSDEQVLGELGWTAQIIYDRSGLLPAFWRPPYGDTDARVRAIATYVFGMYTVSWNQDTFDWQLGENPSAAADAQLDSALQGFYHMAKNPGLMILQHELSDFTVRGFIRNYPSIAQLGWVGRAIPDLWSARWYHNSPGPFVSGVSTAVGARPTRVGETAAAATTNVSTTVTANSTLPIGDSTIASRTTTVTVTTPTSIGQQRATSSSSSPSATKTGAAVQVAAPLKAAGFLGAVAGAFMLLL